MPARRAPTAILLALALGVGGCGADGRSPSPAAPPPRLATWPVTKVSDGDTIHVTYRGADERVRLIGVDTPEVPWYGHPGECFGVEAGLYARRRLSGAAVGLVFDRERRDRYGRLLAYVFLGSELFNLTLVRQGYASVLSIPPDTRFASAFAAAEREARAAGRGLWAACPNGNPP